jgi:hypothetical protein
MELNNRIEAFIKLGKFFRQFEREDLQPEETDLNTLFYNKFNALIKTVKIHNPWFTEENVRNAIVALADSLTEDRMVEWTANYIDELSRQKPAKTVAVIMAGNIPLVGFNDFLCVLISGNKFLGKLSSDDKLLLPFVAEVLTAIEPEFVNCIQFTEGQIKIMDAVIATGSNNSARYFEYYFGKYPHIIRKNRNSVAVLTGAETAADLRNLGKDIFAYFGLGCRNVSKLFVPTNYNFEIFFESIFEFQDIINNNKYSNNYDYNRTVYLMKNDPSLLDNNFLLLKKDSSYTSPIGVLFYENYETIEDLNQKIEDEKEQIQCVVSNSLEIKNSVAFGKSQCPTLFDYADGVDTMKFLLAL